jgi:hypothetical protein
MKIAFWTPAIDVRGTCVALYDYAHYNETILQNKSIIVAPATCMNNADIIAVDKFRNRFQLYIYENKNDLESALVNCDVLYTIKYGKNDGFLSETTKTVVHCVFDMSEPHGDIYAGVSETIAKKFNKTLFVPHMINLQPSMDGSNLREELNIPKDVIVFGRHGGMDTFDLDFAKQSISRVVNNHSNIYFVFVNTPVFCKHPHVIHLSKIITNIDKNKFISTCDAHLECGSMGHSFGLSMAEFSVNNKPIIAYNGPVWNRAHLDILGDDGIYFTSEEELYTILTTFDPIEYATLDINCYRKFTPHLVMKIFNNVFLSSSME